MNLKRKIKESGFTLEQIANAMGISQPALSKMIINGNPTYTKLKEIADILGISTAELISDEDTPTQVAKLVCPHCKKVFKLIEEDESVN